MYILTLILTTTYFLLIAFFIYGWRKIPVFSVETAHTPSLRPAIIVAVRDEQHCIGNLLNLLAAQTYKNFDLYIIDDHSTDNTLAEIEKYAHKFDSIMVCPASHYGKKHAITQGVNLVVDTNIACFGRGVACPPPTIITIDADCRPNVRWLETICAYQSQHQCDLLILPVSLTVDNSLFEHLQQLEFATLVGVGAGAAGGRSPIMCNAANMLFASDVHQNAQAELHFELLSGDDIFLLESVKKHHGKIHFVKSDTAMVHTVPAPTLREFFRQRRRWASKAPAYNDKLLIFTSMLIFLYSFTEITMFIAGLFIPQLLVVFFILFGVKLLADLLFIAQIRAFFYLKNPLKNALLLSLVYPFYIFLTSLTALLSKNYKL